MLKRSFIISSALTVFLIPSFVFAQSSSLGLLQTGDKNLAEIRQQANAGELSVAQTGNDASLKAWQGAGSDNQLMVEQVSSPGAAAQLVQWGSGNEQNIAQIDSAGAKINTWQGHTKIATTNSLLEITQDNSPEGRITAIQEGDSNILEIDQLNSVGGVISMWAQTGNQNSAYLSQDNAAGSGLTASQVGDRNEMVVTQLDGKYDAMVEQYGNDNVAIVEQGFQATP